MLVLLKTLHFISLWAAGGLGVGGWVLQHVHKRNGQPVASGSKYPRMGVLALIAVLTLWITGYLLSGMIYGGLPTSGAFHAKLTGATLILICSLGQILKPCAQCGWHSTAGGPMAVFAWTVRISLLVVLMGAAAFSSS